MKPFNVLSAFVGTANAAAIYVLRPIVGIGVEGCAPGQGVSVSCAVLCPHNAENDVKSRVVEPPPAGYVTVPVVCRVSPAGLLHEPPPPCATITVAGALLVVPAAFEQARPSVYVPACDAVTLRGEVVVVVSVQPGNATEPPPDSDAEPVQVTAPVTLQLTEKAVPTVAVAGTVNPKLGGCGGCGGGDDDPQVPL